MFGIDATALRLEFCLNKPRVAAIAPTLGWRTEPLCGKNQMVPVEET
jgi:hypothetical protein